MDMQVKASGIRDIPRLISVIWVLLADYRALRRFVGGAKDPEAPSRFVAHLEELGPAFVKLGQMLITRPDLMPQAYVDALSRLQENGPVVPGEAIRAAVESQLGKPPEELFATFEPRSAATASLSQVHRATLPDGTVVAVKVQRPDLERLVCRDLDAMEAGLALLHRLFPRRLQRTNLRAFFAEFRRYTLQELDFSQEGRVIDRFRANFKDRVDVKFPTVYWSYTSHRVITMSWVEGLRLHEPPSRSMRKQNSGLSRFSSTLCCKCSFPTGYSTPISIPETFSFTLTALSPCSISACMVS